MAITAPNPKLEKFLSAIEKRKETFGKAIIYIALVITELEIWRVGYVRITFTQREEPLGSNQKLDYGDFILIKNYVDVSEIIELLRSVYEKGILKIHSYADFPVKVSFNYADSVPSQGHYLSSKQWPMFFSTQSIEGNTAQLPINPLSKLGLPLYPNGSEAVITFFELKRYDAWQNLGNYFEVNVPDFRARIKSLRLSGNRATVEIEANAIEEKNMRAKFFCRTEGNTYTSEDLSFKSGKAAFSMENEPYIVEAHILSTVDDESIDRRNFDYRHPSKEAGIVFEDDEIQLIDIISKGENETVEFKETFEAKSQRQFLETVVAFANTTGGRLFIGVSDNGAIKDFRDDIKMQIQDLIQGNCYPDIKAQIKPAKIGEHQILVVEVLEGEDKPYFYNNRGIFINGEAQIDKLPEWNSMIYMLSEVKAAS